jgi:hypothetical protein
MRVGRADRAAFARPRRGLRRGRPGAGRSAGHDAGGRGRGRVPCDSPGADSIDDKVRLRHGAMSRLRAGQ